MTKLQKLQMLWDTISTNLENEKDQNTRNLMIKQMIAIKLEMTVAKEQAKDETLYN